MQFSSISKKLLKRVLSLYFTLTILVTGVQIAAEYMNTKNHINNELVTLEQTFSGSLTRAIWELNNQQALEIAQGLIAIPVIKGITITNESQEVIVQLGDVFDNKVTAQTNEQFKTAKLGRITGNNFGHTFPLIFEFSGRTAKVGTVTLISSNSVILDRIQVGLFFLVGNAIVKTAALVLLFSMAFSSLLSAPLRELTEQIQQFEPEDPGASKVHIPTAEQNELNILQTEFNNLLDELILYKERLSQAQNEVIASNNKLDEQNLLLEQEVARKTSSLSSTMLKMERQQKELLEQQERLQQENSRRSLTERTLTQSNKDLKSSIVELNKTKMRLLEAEKLSILGSLSVQVSHEANTPIGISITSVSYLNDLFSKLNNDLKTEQLSRKSLEEFVKHATNSIDLLSNNLSKSAELIASFKQVSADQLSDKIRNLNIERYVNDVVKSLSPLFTKTGHRVQIDCPEHIEIFAPAGAIAQIFTNLIINSIMHGFEGMNNGVIFISINMYNERLHIRYQDNGIGIDDYQLSQLFEPFYTTKAEQGCTGLGTHIVKKLVNDTLNGTIVANSNVNGGLCYDIEFDNMQ